MKKTIVLSLCILTIIFAGCDKKQEQLSAKAVVRPLETADRLLITTAPYSGWNITYTNGNILNGSDYIILSDNNVTIDEERLALDVKTATESYNTYSNPYPFNTTNIGIVEISGGTYGSVVDIDAEYEEILNMFRSTVSQKNRKPIYKKEMEDISNTYVEISIKEQKVYVYIDGQLVNQTDCVTGTEPNRRTPTGLYYISERINGKILRGPGYATWVNKWMRLTNSGVGLHDAVWKKKFGGNIYTYDGSHGCINLPLNFASWLFDNSYVNMPVIIY